MKNLPWINYLIEFVTVVLGILLAFGLNTYYNNRIEEERVSHFLEGVEFEIAENAKEVTKRLAYHEKIKIDLTNQPNEVVLQLRTPRIKNYAWQIAQDNAISQYISYDLYRKLAEIYSVQSRLDQTSNEAGNMMSHFNVMSPLYVIGVQFNEGDEKAFSEIIQQGWIPIFEDLIDDEKRLEELYKEALEMF